MKKALLVTIFICLSACNNVSNHKETTSEIPVCSLSSYEINNSKEDAQEISFDERDGISSFSEDKKIGYPYDILNITSEKQENGGTKYCLNLNSEFYIDNIWFSPEDKIVIESNYTYFLIDGETLEYVNTPTFDFINERKILNGYLDVITTDKYVKFDLSNLKEITSRNLTAQQVNTVRCMNDEIIVMNEYEKIIVENFKTGKILKFVIELFDKNTISAFFIDKNTVVYELYEVENLLGIGVIRIDENSNKYYPIQNPLTGITKGIAIFSTFSIKYELNINPEMQVYIVASPNFEMEKTSFINDGQYIISENGSYMANVKLDTSFNGNMSVTVYDFKTKIAIWNKEINHGKLQSQKISLSNDGTKILFTDEGIPQQFYVYSLN